VRLRSILIKGEAEKRKLWPFSDEAHSTTFVLTCKKRRNGRKVGKVLQEMSVEVNFKARSTCQIPLEVRSETFFVALRRRLSGNRISCMTPTPFEWKRTPTRSTWAPSAPWPSLSPSATPVASLAASTKVSSLSLYLWSYYPYLIKRHLTKGTSLLFALDKSYCSRARSESVRAKTTSTYTHLLPPFIAFNEKT